MQLELFQKPVKEEKSYWWSEREPSIGDLIQISVAIADYWEVEEGEHPSRYCNGDYGIILEYDGERPIVLVVDPFSENFMRTFIVESIDDLSPKMYSMIYSNLFGLAPYGKESTSRSYPIEYYKKKEIK